jgi:hypothetical protein
MVFLSCIHISTPVDGRMCFIHIWMHEGNTLKIACTGLPENEHFDVPNM